jgi:hypothetical protein
MHFLLEPSVVPSWGCGGRSGNRIMPAAFANLTWGTRKGFVRAQPIAVISRIIDLSLAMNAAALLDNRDRPARYQLTARNLCT